MYKFACLLSSEGAARRMLFLSLVGNYQLLCMDQSHQSTMPPSTYLVPMADGGYQMAQFTQMPMMPVGTGGAGIAPDNSANPGGVVLAVPVLPQVSSAMSTHVPASTNVSTPASTSGELGISSMGEQAQPPTDTQAQP